MEMFDRISNDIKEAMKAKDKVALATLRNIKKVLLEAKTAPGAGDTVSDEAALKIIRKLVKQGRESAELYESQNRADLAAEELGHRRQILGRPPILCDLVVEALLARHAQRLHKVDLLSTGEAQQHLDFAGNRCHLLTSILCISV